MKRVTAKLPWFLVVFALVASGCAAPKSQMRSSVEEAALARVTSVTGEELPDRVRLNIEGTTTLAYTVFRLSEPLRLIVDLADTDITGLGELITVDLGNVATVSPVQFDEVAGRIGRLEVSLVELWDYETSRADNTIIIDFLKPVTVSEEAPRADEMLSAQPASEEPLVEVVELELTSGGETAGAQGDTMAEGTAAAAAQVQEDLPPAGFINSVLFVEAGDGLTVEFVADGTVSEYLTMDLSDPTRLVLDVQNVAKGFAPSRIPVEMGGVTNIRVGEHYDQNKLRFVFDMEGDHVPPYVVESVGSGLVLRIGEGVVPVQQVEAAAAQPEAAAAQPEPAPSFTEVSEARLEPAPAAAVGGAVAQSDGGVSEIRYRAEVSGGAVLVISDSPVDYEISQPDASHLLIDLRDVDLSRDLVRSQDTRDMDGALQSISSYNPRGGGGGRISLTFTPGTTYEVDQTGGTLTVSLTAPVAVPMAQPMAQEVQPETVALTQTPVSPAPVPAAATASATEKMMVEDKLVPKEEGPKYTGERITLDFQNADLLNVLRLIAEVSGLNIITAEGVGGKISMRMQDVPWDQALDIILKTKGLGQVREGNVVRIAPRAILEGEKLAELKAKEAEVKMENLILEIVPISYSKAEDLVSQLNSFLSARGSITTDKRTNSLIVKDIEENVEKIRNLVIELDIPTPQVRIEARIVIVDEGYVKNLGIQWGGVYDDGAGTQIFGESGTASTTFSGALVNMPASNANTVLGFTFGNINNFTSLDLRLSALEQTNNGRIISSPSLLVIQNETANIEVNNPFPENRTSTEVSDEGSTTTTEVSFPDIWTKLKITPQVTSSDDIFMEVLVEKDSKGQQAIFDDNIFTGVNSHKLETKIILKNHGTAVIGGLFTENEGQSNSSVPFISKIPVLGWLFKNKNSTNNRDELLIFINATIVEG